MTSIRKTLQEIVSKNDPRKSPQSGVVQKDRDQWTVIRLWVDEGKSTGLMAPSANMSPVLGKSYRDIALQRAREDSWQRSQRRGREQAVRYSLESPAGQKRPRTLESGVDFRIPRDLKRLHAILRSYGRDVQQHRAPRSEMGVHPGAFKVLANLLSMRTSQNAPH